MSLSVTISGTTYTLNQEGDSPPWGEQLSALLQALVDVSNNVQGTGDILTTSFSIANNQAAAANVTSLTFDTGTIRSAIISYSLYRTTSTNESSEAGVIIVTYKSTAATWELIQYSGGTSGVTFSITTGGQIQYTSTNLSGTSYSGLMKFSAKAFTNS